MYSWFTKNTFFLWPTFFGIWMIGHLFSWKCFPQSEEELHQVATYEWMFFPKHPHHKDSMNMNFKMTFSGSCGVSISKSIENLLRQIIKWLILLYMPHIYHLFKTYITRMCSCQHIFFPSLPLWVKNQWGKEPVYFKTN